MLRRLLTTFVVLAALAAPSTAAATHEQQDAPHGITTHGASIASAPHDLARVGFGASARRRTPAAAQRSSSARLTRMITAVRRTGVAAEDVRTGSIRLSRVLRRTRGGRLRVLGYRATQTLRVTVRDITRTSAVVDAAVRAGATSVSGPDFDISNRAEVYRQALRAALRDARTKAQALAEEAGLTLGRVISVVESGDVEPTSASALAAPAGDDEDAGAGGRVPARTPVRPGTELIGAFVTVTFETS